MQAEADNLEAFLGAVLRGAAKILGCSSTTLIVINDRTQEIRLCVGALAVSFPVLGQVEQLLGEKFNGLSMPIRQAQSSLIYKSWQDQSILETCSLAEVVGDAFPSAVTKQITQLIGEHRFICVPAQSGARAFGVLMFEKPGTLPFSRQQRELLQRYARRIGEIIRNDLRGHQHKTLYSQRSPDGLEYLLFDSEGSLLGYQPGTGGIGPQLRSPQSPAADAQVPADAAPGILHAIRARVKAFANGSKGHGDETAWEQATGLQLELSRLTLSGTDAVLCAVHQPALQSATSLENQLLQLTLGDTAPALFVDPSFRVTSCNEAVEQLFGYTTHDLLHRPISTLFRDRQQILDILSPQILYPASPYCAETTIIVRKDGSLAPARVEALLLADEHDQVVGYLVLIREDSDAAAEVPEHLVQDRLASVGEMTAQLAHEIRNPLVAIGATLESLSREDLAQEHRSILSALNQEIVRVDMVLQHYLTARNEIRLFAVRVAEVIQQARVPLEAAHKAAKKTISVNIDPDLTVRGEPESLKQIFFNVLLNALEASSAETEVICSASVGEHDVSIFVDDRGTGLSASAADCFQPFFTTKRNGTGLGLAVCQKIARAHGGIMRLRAREGGGCRAELILPRYYGHEVVS